MRKIGITGGVGCGKSEVMSFLERTYDCRLIRTDELAHDLMRQGTSCYEKIRKEFGPDIVGTDGEFDRKALAAAVFQDREKLEILNGIVHPAVREAVIRLFEEAEAAGEKLFFLEAALLIEENYDIICDELWYVYADEQIRAERLKKSRGYSDEKIRSIMKSQLPEEVFREKCAFVIDNSGDFSGTESQIREKMKRITAEPCGRE